MSSVPPPAIFALILPLGRLPLVVMLRRCAATARYNAVLKRAAIPSRTLTLAVIFGCCNPRSCFLPRRSVFSHYPEMCRASDMSQDRGIRPLRSP